VDTLREMKAQAASADLIKSICLHLSMLENPDLQDEKIVACLQAESGLRVAEMAFLPPGTSRASISASGHG
jgi:hypothetical protein